MDDVSSLALAPVPSEMAKGFRESIQIEDDDNLPSIASVS